VNASAPPDLDFSARFASMSATSWAWDIMLKQKPMSVVVSIAI